MPYIQHKVRGWFTSFLANIIPNRVKRLIFLSSLIAYIQGTEKPDTALAGKINRLLSLAHRETSIYTPSLIKDKIWPNIIARDTPIGQTGVALCDLCEIEDYRVNTYQARSISNQIIGHMPQALRYGSNRQMKSDLVTLLMNIPKLQHA
jgi:hypothetical protein